MLTNAQPRTFGVFDYWLRGDSEAAVLAAMTKAEIPTLPSTESSFDPIGTIWTHTGTMDDNGNPIMEPLPGWHANLRMRAPMTEHQETALVNVLILPPQNPVRVWA